MAQHHALGIPGRSGSIDDCSQVIGLRLANTAVACKRRIVPLYQREILDVDDKNHLVHAFPAELRQHAAGNENGLASRMIQDIGDLVFRRIRKYGHRNPSERHKREHGDSPVGHILGKYRHPVPRPYAIPGQPRRNLVAFFPEFAVCITHVGIKHD